MRQRIGHYNPERTIGPPVRHLSRGGWLVATRYVVGWPDAGIVKVGSSIHGRARYGKFLSRGAEVVDIAQYPELMDSLHAEYWLMDRLDKEYSCAFKDRSEAVEILPQGAGWTECYAVPKADWAHVIELANERSDD